MRSDYELNDGMWRRATIIVCLVGGCVVALAVWAMNASVAAGERTYADYCRGKFAFARSAADSQAVLNEPHSNWSWTGGSCATYVGRTRRGKGAAP